VGGRCTAGDPGQQQRRRDQGQEPGPQPFEIDRRFHFLSSR
jgi:hypothetical protein